MKYGGSSVKKIRKKHGKRKIKKKKNKSKKTIKNEIIKREVEELQYSTFLDNVNLQKGESMHAVSKENNKSANNFKASNRNLENYTSIVKNYSSKADNSKKSESAILIRPKVKSLTKPPLLQTSKAKEAPKEKLDSRQLISEYDIPTSEENCIYCNDRIVWESQPVLLFTKALDKNFRELVSKTHLKEISRLGPGKGKVGR